MRMIRKFVATVVWAGSLGLFALPATAYAGALLSGTVTGDGAAVAGAEITVQGNNRVLHATSDNTGHFRLIDLPLGTYDVAARHGGGAAHVQVDLGSGGASIALYLTPVREIGHTITSLRGNPVRGSGADSTLNGNDLTRAPYGGSLPEALIQLPGAVRGANGVVHMNGDHGVIDYVVDGIPIPQALNREMGSEVNPNDVAFLDVIEGAYPAQYGLRFGSVLNISTKAGAGPAGFDVSMGYGSYSNVEQTLGYHTPLANGGGFSVGIRNAQSTRGLDPPNFSSPHNHNSDTNQYFKLSFPDRRGNFTDLSFTHSFRTYQVPNDVDNGAPANTNDSESQNDGFVSLQWHHPIGETGSLTIGPAFKYSRVRDYGDPANDFAYIENLNVENPPFGNGGTSTDCGNAFTKGVLTSTTCGYSLSDDKTALDYILQGDYVRQAGKHDIRAGVSYDATRVLKNYSISMQPNNFLSANPVTFIDNNPNIGNTYASYLQDSWRMSPLWEADYGTRYDFFSIRSTSFYQGFGQVSPRFKFTRFFGQRASVYGYIGRFFEPFSFENVDPFVAQAINAPVQASVAQFDLLPERDTQLEFGGHVPLGSGSLGFRVWQKNANSLIDDTQVGMTLLHQDINYLLGRLSQESVSYIQPLARGGRAYVNVAHTLSLNASCQTQLLAASSGITDFSPADHDQAYSVTSGVLLNGRGGGWFSANGEYGSGLSSAICSDGTPGFCKRTPHTIFALEQGVPIGAHAAVSLRVNNVLNDRYFVTVLNAQGNHYAEPRTINIAWQLNR